MSRPPKSTHRHPCWLAPLSLLMAVIATCVPRPAWCGDADAVILGLYDPYLPFVSPLHRVEFVTKIAESISKDDEITVRGEAFSKAADLQRAVQSNKVHIAILNAQFYSEQGKRLALTPAHSVVAARSSQQRYAIFSSVGLDARNLSGLRGRRLAVIRTGRQDRRFIMNALLWGELRRPGFFGELVAVPDVAGAFGALAFGRADAAILPDIDYGSLARKGKGIRRMLSVGRAPGPVVVVSANAPAKATQRLRSVLNDPQVWRPVGLDHIGPVETSALASLARALSTDPRVYNRQIPLLAPPDALDDRQVLESIRVAGVSMLPDPLSLLSNADNQP